MKKLLCLLLAILTCISLVSCGGDIGGGETSNTDSTTDSTDVTNGYVFGEGANKTVAFACSFTTAKYDVSKIVSGKDYKILKGGEEIEGNIVPLSLGTNEFRIIYKVSGIERICDVRIARRDKLRVVFNSNSGSFVESRYVDYAGTIDDSTIVPTRDRYNFLGWYNEKGEKVTLSSTPIMDDTVLIAHWEGPLSYAYPEKDASGAYTPLTYTTSSAALNIVWRDYDNAFGLRPDFVTCELKNTSTGMIYAVRVTKNSAEFVGSAPAGATISQGGGNWTVKIRGLTEDYTFVQKDLDGAAYTTVQSGTSVVHTVNDYSPAHDDTSSLMTMNGRFYDHAGNVIVLKGLVTLNAGWKNLVSNTSTPALKRWWDEGVNSLRITMMVGGSDGYHLKGDLEDGEQTEAKRKELFEQLCTAVDSATALGMYTIIDWGVMMTAGTYKTNPANQYLKSIQDLTNDLFTKFAQRYKDNPYVVFEICNEPMVTGDNGWENYIKPFEESVIRTIRNVGAENVIIAAPNNYARRLSNADAERGDDPIDKPFDTEIAYNVAYTFHCYPTEICYNHHAKDGQYNLGWRLTEAVKAGITIVATELNPGSEKQYNMADGAEATSDFKETEKFINTFLENDMNYMFFRYTSPITGGKWIDQVADCFKMFKGGKNDYLSNGTWTLDMMNDCGIWFYNIALNSTGFIKVADFDYVGKIASGTFN